MIFPFASRKTLLSLCLATVFAAGGAHALEIDYLASYETGLAEVGEKTSGETAALRGDKLYVTNADDISLDIVDVANPAQPSLIKRVSLASFGASVTSVAVSSKNLVAVAVVGANKTDAGTVVFMTPAGQVVRTARVGALPDMITFTPDGRRLLVANEGEPNCYGEGCVDPEGSVSIIDVIPMKPQLPVRTVGFNGVDLPADVRIFGPGASVAQDLEPEYITVSPDGRTAYVTLQENNAHAVIDIEAAQVLAVRGFGYKDHGLSGQGLDASDKDKAINIQTYRGVLGMYQPDAIASYVVGGQTYLVTANEGDARDYDGFAEESRAKALASTQPGLQGIDGISDDKKLGRLTVTKAAPAGDFNNLYVFGARSFSIWNAADGSQVWDSGDQLERITADLLPGNFNSNNDANTFDDRSDNKGPEPEGVAVGQVGARTYAFVGLERIGGFMVYDISIPAAPTFVEYVNNRSFASGAFGPDSGPEVIRFVPAKDSPNGRPLLVVANEITGTVSLFGLGE